MPVVSVILIFLNEERFLEEAVQSVRDQTMQDWELILVDDGSTDESTLIARNLAADDMRIRYVDHPGHENRGMSAARNLGAAHATAPYLTFFDADDVYAATMLADQVDLLETMPDVAMVSGAIYYWYSWDPETNKADFVLLTGGVADRRIEPPEAAVNVYPLARASNAGGTDVLVRRSVFDEIGGFEERFRGPYSLYEDQAFLIKVYMRYPIYVSSRAWRRYRLHDASCCQQVTSRDYWRVRSFFLDWLEADVGRLGDPLVSAAFRRSRRELRYRKLIAPTYDAYVRARDRVPAELKGRLKRTLAARETAG